MNDFRFQIISKSSVSVMKYSWTKINRIYVKRNEKEIRDWRLTVDHFLDESYNVDDTCSGNAAVAGRAYGIHRHHLFTYRYLCISSSPAHESNNQEAENLHWRNVICSQVINSSHCCLLSIKVQQWCWALSGNGKNVGHIPQKFWSPADCWTSRGQNFTQLCRGSSVYI